jgi:hypothetical protein
VALVILSHLPGPTSRTMRTTSDSARIRANCLSGMAAAVLHPWTRPVAPSSARPRCRHPEGFRVDADGGRALVNVPAAAQIAVVDLTGGRQATAWRIPGLHANFPMTWDEANRVLAVVYYSPARLVLLDSGSGSVKET